MKSESIDKIRKRFHREWLLLEIDHWEKKTFTPITAHLITHSPLQHEIYKKMMEFKNSKKYIAVEYSEDRLPPDVAVAFLIHA